MNSISKIWKKFEYYNYIGIKVLGRCELIQRLLIEKLVKASVKGLWKNSVEEEESLGLLLLFAGPRERASFFPNPK